MPFIRVFDHDGVGGYLNTAHIVSVRGTTSDDVLPHGSEMEPKALIEILGESHYRLVKHTPEQVMEMIMEGEHFPAFMRSQQAMAGTSQAAYKAKGE